MQYRDPDAIVSTEWLAAHLADADLRLFDCTVYLRPAPPDSGRPYRPESGRADHERGHIPGAAFLDLIDELSDPDSDFYFMFPSPERFAAAMERNGIGAGAPGGALQPREHHVGDPGVVDAARVRIRGGGARRRLRQVGAGGAPRLPRSGLPSARAASRPARAPGLFVDRHAVREAIGDEDTVLVNALAEEWFRGEIPSRYGRRGRIPGSVSVPAGSLLDADTRAFVSLKIARERFDAAGVDGSRRVIAYCGGGISATVDLFLLHQLGHDALSLYDASMGEWAKDESLPIERG